MKINKNNIMNRMIAMATPRVIILFLLFFMVALSPALLLAQNALQSSTPESVVAAESKGKLKPKLVPIILNEETNDPKAVEIASKLEPKFFDLPPDPKGVNNPKYYARQFSFNKRQFLAYKIVDNFFFCSRLGCPITIFVNLGDNKWKKIASFQSYKVLYDLNSQNKKYPNLVLSGFERVEGKPIPIYVWNGLKYEKIN